MSNFDFIFNSKSYRADSKDAVKRGISSMRLALKDIDVLTDARDSVNSMTCQRCEDNIGFLTAETNGFVPFVVARAFGLEDGDRERFGTSVAVCDSCARKGNLSPVAL